MTEQVGPAPVTGPISTLTGVRRGKPPAEGMVFIPGRNLSDGIRQPLSRGSADARRHRWSFLDGPVHRN